jgi:hypothetical protein
MQPYKLTEGNTYLFTIRRIIEMPPEGEAHYVVESEFGSKHLIPKQFYGHYNLMPGQSLRCRIDKINCSGKIYLEPEHPGCKPGDLLNFSVIGKESVVNSFGEKETLLLLNDPWKQLTHLNILGHEALAEKEILACRVERIKKGKLLVSYPGIHQPDPLPPNSGALEFTLKGIITLSENFEFYTLDRDGERHYLRTKYYAQYGFEKGSKINCRILGEPVLYAHYLEPVHPYYEPKKEYWFEFIRVEYTKSIDGESEYNLIIKDLLGHEYGLPFKGPEPRWPARVKAFVKEIRMSKCILDLVTIE